MRKHTIFVEGTSDIQFLRQYLLHCFPDVPESELPMIVDMKGKDPLIATPDLVKPNFDRVRLLHPDGQILVVFDADGNPQKRAAELRKAAAVVGDFEQFLFPNDADTGELETLLCELVPNENRVVLDCFDGFKTCLQQHSEREFFLPVQKAKVFAYLDAVLSPGKKEQIQDNKRDYRDPAYWDLDAPYLAPLRTFLTRHLLGSV